jgi:hypothetical protein
VSVALVGVPVPSLAPCGAIFCAEPGLLSASVGPASDGGMVPVSAVPALKRLKGVELGCGSRGPLKKSG